MLKVQLCDGVITGNGRQITGCTRDVDREAPMSVAEFTGLVGRIMKLNDTWSAVLYMRDDRLACACLDTFHPP